MATYTYTIGAPGAGFVGNKCMIGLYNAVGSGLVLRVYRIWSLNNQTQAPTTATQQVMNISRLTTGSGGISLLAVKHDSQAPSLPAQIVTATNMDYTIDTTIRRYAWSNSEPLSSAANGIDEQQTVPAFNMVWDYSASYINTTVEPLVLREGYGVAVILGTLAAGVLASGSADFFIEFTSGTT